MQALKTGINHIEFWVNDLKQSLKFYEPIFKAIGWNKLGETEFSSGSTVVYLVEHPAKRVEVAGPRHICFQAGTRDVVDAVGKILMRCGATIIRGPVEMPEYSKGYYTVDFRDPDGYVLEVAHTPNMKF
jgi:catechol 2,3-dioxygenase-like lactoylglutathione lyase family enzyme